MTRQMLNGQPLIYNATPPTFADGESGGFQCDVNGNLMFYNAKLQAGEDIPNDVQKVEERFTYKPVMVANTQVKASAGFVHSVTISQLDVAPTAGLILVYDGTAVDAAKIIFQEYVTTGVFSAHTVILDVVCETGIYVVNPSADVSVSISYR